MGWKPIVESCLDRFSFEFWWRHSNSDSLRLYPDSIRISFQKLNGFINKLQNLYLCLSNKTNWIFLRSRLDHQVVAMKLSSWKGNQACFELQWKAFESHPSGNSSSLDVWQGHRVEVHAQINENLRQMMFHGTISCLKSSLKVSFKLKRITSHSTSYLRRVSIVLRRNARQFCSERLWLVIHQSKFCSVIGLSWRMNQFRSKTGPQYNWISS